MRSPTPDSAATIVGARTGCVDRVALALLFTSDSESSSTCPSLEQFQNFMSSAPFASPRPTAGRRRQAARVDAPAEGAHRADVIGCARPRHLCTMSLHGDITVVDLKAPDVSFRVSAMASSAALRAPFIGAKSMAAAQPWLRGGGCSSGTGSATVTSRVLCYVCHGATSPGRGVPDPDLTRPSAAATHCAASVFPPGTVHPPLRRCCR